MANRAVVVVDLQNEYLPTGNLPLVGIEDAVANAVGVIDTARANGDPVVFIRHESAGADAPIFAAGSQNVELIPAIHPMPEEPVIVKHFPNSFRETGLQALLDEQGITDVVVIGAMSHMCIDATVRAAADFGYAVTVVEDACATRDLEFAGKTVAAADVHAAFMSALAFGYANVVAAEDHPA
ncbi:MAG: cysteine hydrolase family protein [Thermomicrobiales bacterium]